MADEQVQTDAQVQTEGQETGTGTETAAHGNQRTFDGEYDESRARALIDNLREAEKLAKTQGAQARTELQQAQAKLKEYEDAKLSTEQRQTRDLDEYKDKVTAYESRMREMALWNEVLAESASLNIIDPRAAAKLLDSKAIKYGDDGEPTNVREELEKLLKDAPYLKKAEGGVVNTRTTAATSTANPPRTDATQKPTFKSSEIGDVKFWDANKDAILTAMREGRIERDD